MKRLLCFLGFHDWELVSTSLLVTKKYRCRRCPAEYIDSIYGRM